MTLRLRVTLAIAVALLALAVACKGALPYIEAALTASQIACIATSTLTDSNALAEACAIDKALVPRILPVLENLVAQREAAARAGVRWHVGGFDGGLFDAAPAPAH